MVKHVCCSDESGFSLLEVVISLAVIGLAFVTLLTVHRQNLERWQKSRDSTRIYLLAQELINEATVTGTPPPGEGERDGVAWRITAAPAAYPGLMQIDGRFWVAGGELVHLAQWVRVNAGEEQ